MKRWIIKESDEQKVENLYRELKINKTLCKLLVLRGIETYDQAKRFFRPSLDHLYDPFLMTDMDKAVARIDEAMHNKEKILVYGDYDVDGTTAVALVYSFFKEFYFFVDYYIPDRYAEGYGVSDAGIDWAKENGFTLIIALDCGIKAIEKVDRAKTLGIDFIICDHHRPEEQLPAAVAVLDPKREDCTYPFDELSGCGIGFKLVQAFAQIKSIPFETVAEYLDLVAISIAADIVPLNDENRILTHFGLQRLNAQPRPGIRSLMDLNIVQRELTVNDIVFFIAPRINAAGRMESGKQAVKLLLSQEVGIAKQNASVLQAHNSKRKGFDTDITQEALFMIDSDPNQLSRKSTVLYHNSWHKGVIGIVASRLLEKYYRPTIILTLSNGMVAGSARSVPDFDIYNAIKACSELLEQYGGHKYAAGLTIKEENVSAFMTKFEHVVSETIEDYMLIPEEQIDAELFLLQLSDLKQSDAFYNILKQFAPFGPENLKPVFMTSGLTDTGYSAVVGEKHLKIQAKHGNFIIRGIAYNMGHRYKEIANGKVFDLCYTLEMNKFNGSTSLQMVVKDIRPTQI